MSSRYLHLTGDVSSISANLKRERELCPFDGVNSPVSVASVTESILNVIKVLAPHWRCFQYQCELEERESYVPLMVLIPLFLLTV